MEAVKTNSEGRPVAECAADRVEECEEALELLHPHLVDHDALGLAKCARCGNAFGFRHVDREHPLRHSATCEIARALRILRGLA